MKKNKTDSVVREAEVVDTAQEERRALEQSVAKQIEAVLVDAGLALQPYMSYSEYGVVPRVRLVENKSVPSNEQGNSAGETEGAGNQDASTESSEA